MTDHQEDLQNRIKKGPFQDEPFTEKHKQNVIKTVQQITQNSASRKQKVWLKRMIASSAVCGMILVAAWWVLPNHESEKDSLAVASLSDNTAKNSKEKSADSPSLSMDLGQQDLEDQSSQQSLSAEASIEKRSVPVSSDNELELKELIHEADLIATLNITNTEATEESTQNETVTYLQAQMKDIISSNTEEVPDKLKIQLNETLSKTMNTLLLAKENQVILFLKKTEEANTYSLIGEAEHIYVVSNDNIVSPIRSELEAYTSPNETYRDFIEKIKALAIE